MPRSSGRLETLGAQAIARAFVWVGRAGPERWVDPRMFGDRSLGEAFACGWLGLIGRPTAGFTIDPMFTKTAGPLDGLTRMRLIAIDAAANQAAGRTLERAIADRARAVLGRCETTRNQGGTPREPKPIRHVSWMTLEQANGLVGFGAPARQRRCRSEPAAGASAVRAPRCLQHPRRLPQGEAASDGAHADAASLDAQRSSIGRSSACSRAQAMARS